MKRMKIICCLLCVAILMACALPVQAAGIRVAIDGEVCDIEWTLPTDGVICVPVRACVTAITQQDCTIDWDGAAQTARITASNLIMNITYDSHYIVANGRYIYNTQKTYAIDGTMFVPIRSLAKAFGASADWDGDNQIAHITRGDQTILNGIYFYNEEDLYWLSRIISSESGTESLQGKIAVGNVVLNRVRDEQFADTVKDVVFECTNGNYQFSPVKYGTVYREPDYESVVAAKICLEGYTVSDEILYFVEASYSENSWFSRNCTYEQTIGNHVFFS